MKNICLISLLLCLCLEATEAQIIVKERRAVQVLPPQTFYLNSTTRASFGGKSKMGVNFVLPPGTVEWYFSFTTARGEKPRTSVELFSQLTKLIDPTGVTAIATNAIFTLPGAGACDILVMDKANAEIFLDKNISSYGSFDYDLASARENFQNGTVKLDNITKGEWKNNICNLARLVDRKHLIDNISAGKITRETAFARHTESTTHLTPHLARHTQSKPIAFGYCHSLDIASACCEEILLRTVCRKCRQRIGIPTEAVVLV